MGIVPQLTVALLIWLVILGSFIDPQLQTYSAQLIALLLLFYIMFKHVLDTQRKQVILQAKEDEQTLLFLSTYLKPKLASLIELTMHEENKILIQKQLEMVVNEINRLLKEKR